MMYFFFFNDTATTEIYTLSLHDALPIFAGTDYVYPRTTNKILEAYLKSKGVKSEDIMINYTPFGHSDWQTIVSRSEEHTSELQSRQYLVCRLLLEKKKKMFFQLYIDYLD